MRNTGRPQPSATQLPGVGPFTSHHIGSPTTPAPTAPNPQNDAFRADYKPDFLQANPSGQRPAPTPEAAPARPQSIAEQYDLARQQLTNPAPVQGFATEKQRRDYAWQVRNDPIGTRDAALEQQRIYQRGPSPSQTPPSRPVNFTGPRPRSFN